MSKDLKERKSDYLLELALEEQLKQDPEMIKYKSGDEVEHPHTFSDEHNKRMRKIFRLADRVERKSEHRKRFWQMAAGFAVVFCILGVSVTQVEAFRLPVIRFFMDVREKYTSFEATVDETVYLTEDFKEYEPHYIPDGFSVQNVYEGKDDFVISFVNDENKTSYWFAFSHDIQAMSVDTEDGYIKEIEINGYQAYVIKKDEKISILMDRDGKRFFLTGTILEGEAIKIIESVK